MLDMSSGVSHVFSNRNSHKDLRDIDVSKIESIDPEAATILRNAVDLLDTTLARRTELDANALNDTPLIVSVGEYHSRPADILLNALYVYGLSQSDEDVMIGQEIPHNSLMQLVQNRGHFKVNDIGQKIIDHADQDGRMSLKADFVSLTCPDALYSRKVLNHTLLSHDVGSAFVDTAFTDQLSDTPAHAKLRHKLNDAHIPSDDFDLDDPTTRTTVDTLLKGVRNVGALKLDARTSEGLHIRNQHMLTTLPKKPINVLLVGDAHVMGWEPDSDDTARLTSSTKNPILSYINQLIQPYRLNALKQKIADQSLSALARTSGFSTLAVVKDAPDLLLQHRLNPTKDLIVHSDMPTYEPNEDDLSEQELYKSEEAAWVNTRLENMGLAALIPANPMDLTAQYHTEIDTLIHDVKDAQLAAMEL